MDRELYYQAMVTATSIAAISEDTPGDHIIWLWGKFDEQTTVLAQSLGVVQPEYADSLLAHARRELEVTLNRIRNL